MIYRLMIQIGTKTALHYTCAELSMKLNRLVCLDFSHLLLVVVVVVVVKCEVCLCLTLSKLYDYIVYIAYNTRIIDKAVTSVCLVTIAIVRIHVM